MIKKITFFLFKILIIFTLIIIITSALFYRNLSKAEAVKSPNSDFSSAILVKFKDRDMINKVQIADKNDMFNIIDSYNNNNNVEFAEPDFIYQAAIIPSDTYFNNQWYLKKVNAPDSWDMSENLFNVTIAIVDSGVMIDHPDLKDHIWVNNKEIPDNNIDDDKNGFIDDVNGWDFVNGNSSPKPKFSPNYTSSGIMHGTIVAGIAAASGNNNQGISGIAWNAKIMALKALNDRGEGDTGDIIRAVDYAVNNGADTINLSFTGHGYSQALEMAIKRAYDAGIIIVAAAGNEQAEGNGYSLDKTPSYPACLDGKNNENMVIGVAATDPIDQKAIFSSFGFKCVDISAPGVSIFSTTVYAPEKNVSDMTFNTYYDGYWSGTSMATPMVSGAIAFIEGLNQKYSRKQIIDALLDNADNINRLNPSYLAQLGTGRLNIFKATYAAKVDLIKKKINIIVGPYKNKISQLKILDNSYNAILKFNAYDDKVLSGVNVAAGDVDGDGQDEIITGPGAGGGPHIKVFDQQGKLKSQFFAYTQGFRGGVNVAAGDIDGDGQDEIITGPGAGGGPHIKVFDQQGKLKSQFFAYTQGFRGGVNVAAGDIDGDGQDEIITGPGAGGGPHIKVFDQQGKLKSQFFAYTQGFRGGVNVAAGDIIGGSRSPGKEIVVAPKENGGPQIMIYSGSGQLVGQFFAFNKKFRGGVNITLADTNKDSIDEIICGAGPGGTPHVRVFNRDGDLLDSFIAYENSYSGGVDVSSITQ